MKFRPINNTLVVAVDPAPEKTAGGIIVPYNAELPFVTGTVKAVGRGILMMTGEVIPPQCQPGDRVVIGGMDLKQVKRIDFEGADCVCLPDEGFILGILET